MYKTRKSGRRKSIFRSLFIPLFLIMVLQGLIFYFAAVYGGVEESLTQNAADILSERLYARKNELETRFNSSWTDFDSSCIALDEIYSRYKSENGDKPLLKDTQLQIDFLAEASDILIDTLRHNRTNGIYLILNSSAERQGFGGSSDSKYGLCIRDMDPESNYSGREDLLLERSPSSIIDMLSCSLDSWWEAKYAFATENDGDFFYYPIEAAWANPNAEGKDLAYFSGSYKISESDQPMISYSIPLIDPSGYPYAVLGIELSIKYLASFLPHDELNDPDKCCYILSLCDEDCTDATSIMGTGALYSRCFGSGAVISIANREKIGGFGVTGRGDVELYGNTAKVNIYNTNNPFEDRHLTLIALVERDTLFAYIERIKLSLFIVSLCSLVIGIMGIAMVSRSFAAPITALSSRVREMKTRDWKDSSAEALKDTLSLDRLGIAEIDLLVDSIEDLNKSVSKNHARTEFFSRMSHDMRTPMNAIISFSSPELLEDADESVKDDYLNKIQASGKYLLGLINEVLDISKIENNKIEIITQTLPADTLCDASLSVIEKLAGDKNVFFTEKVVAAPGLYVSADKQHINQIVMNLLSNAVKFTPSGGSVSFTMSMIDDARDRDRVLCRIIVLDTGVGISKAFMEDLYTPFEQENASKEGTGLGLSITRRLVELMGGTIECVSEKNVGTTFTVELPLAIGAAAELDGETGAEEKQSAELDMNVLSGKRILIVEDNEMNVKIICRLLNKAGVETVTAENGREGVDLFKASHTGEFDAVLMDMQMPIMDGVTAAELIRSLKRDDAETIPIIAMTANAFDSDIKKCIGAGMNAHLAKPIDPRLVYETLIRYLS